MGEHPLTMTIELTCPGCQAHFRLRPKKKMPTDDVPCPKCGSAIPVSDSPPPRTRTDRSLLSTPAAPNTLPPTLPTFGSEALRRAPTVPSLQSDSGPSEPSERERTVSIDEETWEKVKRRSGKAAQANPKGAITNPLFPKPGEERVDEPPHEKDPTKETPRFEFNQEPEQGPFDLRDILSAEHQTPGLVNPNEVTKSPLETEGFIPGFMEEDSDLGRSPLSDAATLAISNHSSFEADEEEDAQGQASADEKKEALGALIRKKLGAKKIGALRSRVEGAKEDAEDSIPMPDEVFRGAQTQDDGSEVSAEEESDPAQPPFAGAKGSMPEADKTLESTLSDELSEQIKPSASPALPPAPARSHPSTPRLAVSQSLKDLRSPLRDDPLRGEKSSSSSLNKPPEVPNTRSVSWNQFSPAGARSEVDEQGVAPPTRHIARTRGAQESHSGLFPIRGVGQEASAITGHTGDRRGSGYIRLPTTEILEVLGQGNYRLMVEDIVYEPVDEAGLTELIKRGVLMGAEMIAEPGEEWQPINDHPVFKRLRKKMAIEAHALLSKYASQEAKRQQEAASDQEAPLQDNDAGPTSPMPILPPLPRHKAEAEASKNKTMMMGSLDLARRQDPFDSEEGDDDDNEGADPFDSIVDLSSELEAHPSLSEPASEYSADPASPPHTTRPWEKKAADQGLAGPDFVSLPEESSQPREEGEEEEEELMPLAIAPAEEREQAWQERAEELEAPRTRSGLLPILLLLALCGLCLLGYVLYAHLFAHDLSPAVAPGPPVAQASSVDDAIATAKQRRQLATLDGLGDQASVLGHATRLATQGERDAALGLFAASWDGAVATDAQSLAYIKAMGEKNPEDPLIPKVARAAVAKLGAPKDPRFAPYLQGSATVATGWGAEVMDEAFGQEVRAKNVGDFKVLTILREGKEAWSFKPIQPRYPLDAAHRDVAASRLCQAIQCEILVPTTRLTRLNEDTFTAWGGTSAQAAALPWERDAKGRFLVGSAMAWVPQGLAWPIEFSQLWRPWLAPYEPLSKLSEPLPEALESLKSRNEALYTSAVATQGLSTKRLAQQISAMMVFDYLTNNMNRFRERPVPQGTDNQLLGTQLVSLDHATTFQSRLSSRVAGRFAWAGRYDKGLVDRIKAVDKDALDRALFGEGSALDESEKKAFWSRHADLVSDIEAQVKRYGASDVYPF